MTEKWKDIPGYEGHYQASNLGQIRSMNRMVGHQCGGFRNFPGKVLRQHIDESGHYKLRLSMGGSTKNYKVHTLVMLAWVGPRPHGLEVCHGFGGKRDNSVYNLRYDTKSANSLDCRLTGHGKFRPVIRSDGIEFINIAIAAEETDCCQSHITTVCRGRRKTCGGFGWSYLEKV